jgi:Fe-S-cluster containining protein
VGYRDYLPVDKDDDILGKPDLAQRYVSEGKAGARHLKLTADGRCKALRGPVGGRVRCEIYHYRPGPCRRVQLDSELCHIYRRDAGLEG